MSCAFGSAAALCTTFIVCATTACPPTYEVVGQLEYSCGSQYTIFHINDMNDQRQVVGRLECSIAGLSIPFFWTPDNGLQLIPGLTSVNYPGSVQAINESGVMTGYYVVPQITSGTLPFVYAIGDPSPTPLGAPDAKGSPFQGGGWAREINEAGVIAGRAPDPDGTPRACVWESWLEPTFMPSEQDAAGSEARGIGNDGQVLYRTYTDATVMAWSYQLGEADSTRIEPMRPWIHTTINGSNAIGELAGQASEELSSLPVAVYWDRDRLHLLPTPPETDRSRALGITDTGVIYGDIRGEFGDEYTTLGVVWEDGVMREVRDALGPDISVGRPRAMNNNGDFVASTTAGYLVIGRIHFQPADLDCDQSVGFSDLLHLLAQWGPCSDACTADFDGDGEIAMSDLEMLVEAWSGQ